MTAATEKIDAVACALSLVQTRAAVTFYLPGMLSVTVPSDHRMVSLLS